MKWIWQNLAATESGVFAFVPPYRMEFIGCAQTPPPAFVGTGVLGGFTTYSALALQTANWLAMASWVAAALAVSSLVAASCAPRSACSSDATSPKPMPTEKVRRTRSERQHPSRDCRRRRHRRGVAVRDRLAIASGPPQGFPRRNPGRQHHGLTCPGGADGPRLAAVV